MHKVTAIALMVLIVAAVGSACGTEPAVEPTEVISADVHTVSGNASQVVLQCDFKVKNPNTVEVTLDSLEYAVNVEDKPIGYGQFADDRIIKAGEEIQLSGGVVVTFTSLVYDAVLFQGLSQVEALKALLPYWKKLGGENPAAPMQALWDSIDSSATLTVSGSAYVEAGKQRVSTSFSNSITK